MNKPMPPKFWLRFFRWYCHPDYVEDIEGDLVERFERSVKNKSTWSANWRFTKDVIKLFRPGIIRPLEGYKKLNNYGMLKNYFIIGWRNLAKNKGYSTLNIGGLSLGITITLLIGLWIFDEFSFNTHYENYDKIAAVLQHNTVDGEKDTWSSQSYQLGRELKTNYSNYFDHVVTSSFPYNSILALDDKGFNITGSYMDEQGPELLSLTMLQGTGSSFDNSSTILISSSTAKKFFRDKEVIGEILKIDNGRELKVTGVYEDLRSTDSFEGELGFIAPLDILTGGGTDLYSAGGTYKGWGNNWLQVYVTLADNISIEQASAAIKDVKAKNILPDDFGAKFKPELLVFPMTKWRLFSHFENGINTSGRIEYVWQFGSIGAFVLLLACINFMNLSTARSQKRAKEIGVRKVIGSKRVQLAGQFFVESLLVVSVAFVVGILLTYLSLPWFNSISEKSIAMPWFNSTLWLLILGSIFLITFVSSSYPALYLSGFNPSKALKGSFKLGKYSALPRQVLVVVQFTVSITLIIGTTVVYQQIQHAKDRPLGYNLDGLVNIPIKTNEVRRNFERFRNELAGSNSIAEVSASETSVTNIWPSDGGYEWEGKDPDMQPHIYRGAVSHDFGKTVGWKIIEGRDFSQDIASDSSAMVLNQAAVDYMGLENPVGQIIRFYGRDFKVIGVVENMLSQSAYSPTNQTAFTIGSEKRLKLIHVRANPQSSVSDAIKEIENAFYKYNTETPFEYTFADDEFAEKYAFEEQVATLVSIFTALAIFISCLGLFGLASFMAEQRSKEIGIRKVIGASIFSLWKMLSKDFVQLVIIAAFISIPLGYYFMNDWLQDYQYRMELNWWVFAFAGMAAFIVTLSTVSYQSIKAARMNPVESLKSE
ncbi:MAG: ABC transporter permease [Bacteroidota bacterium]